MRNFCSNLDLEYKFCTHERESPHHGAVLEWKMITGQWVLGGLLGGPQKLVCLKNWGIPWFGADPHSETEAKWCSKPNHIISLFTKCLLRFVKPVTCFFVGFIPMFIRNVCSRYVGDSKIQMFFVGHVDNPLVFTWSKVKISPWQKNSDDKFL